MNSNHGQQFSQPSPSKPPPLLLFTPWIDNVRDNAVDETRLLVAILCPPTSITSPLLRDRVIVFCLGLEDDSRLYTPSLRQFVHAPTVPTVPTVPIAPDPPNCQVEADSVDRLP